MLFSRKGEQYGSMDHNQLPSLFTLITKALNFTVVLYLKGVHCTSLCEPFSATLYCVFASKAWDLWHAAKWEVQAYQEPVVFLNKPLISMKKLPVVGWWFMKISSTCCSIGRISVLLYEGQRSRPIDSCDWFYYKLEQWIKRLLGLYEIAILALFNSPEGCTPCTG